MIQEQWWQLSTEKVEAKVYSYKLGQQTEVARDGTGDKVVCVQITP